MKMKFITAIVAFSVTFGFSAFLTGLLGANNRLHFQAAETNRTGLEITSLLEQDIANGEESAEIYRSGASLSEYAESVGNYVDASESIEDVNLPPDFRFAWQAHMNAWRRHADSLKSHGFSREEFYERDFFLNYSNQSAEIERTWFNVLNIGKKYGAVIPPNAY
jgi:hypothetical protein